MLEQPNSREEALASVAAVEMLPMPAMSEGDGDDGPAYLVGGGGSGSTDVAEQFFRRLKHHWNQGCNSTDIYVSTESGCQFNRSCVNRIKLSDRISCAT